MMKWYMTFERPNMKSRGGAFWPVMLIKDKTDKGTIVHEEVHMKGQLWMGLLPWLLVYLIFLLIDGYYANPFEMWARSVEMGNDEYKPYGWIKYA